MLLSFGTELRKAHRRQDLLLCLLVPVIMVLWVGGLSPSQEDELANGYSALFYSIPVIQAILMPVMMAVLASRLWDMEIKGNMNKLLYTLQSRRSLFVGKALFGFLEVVLTTVLEMGLASLLGVLHSYTEPFSWVQFLYLSLCSLAVSGMLFFMEFFLIVRFRNPLPTLCTGITGALLGLFSAFMPPIVSYFIPWGYFIPLSAYEVSFWDQETHTVLYGTRNFNFGLLAFTILLGVGFFCFTWQTVRKEEV